MSEETEDKLFDNVADRIAEVWEYAFEEIRKRNIVKKPGRDMVNVKLLISDLISFVAGMITVEKEATGQCITSIFSEMEQHGTTVKMEPDIKTLLDMAIKVYNPEEVKEMQNKWECYVR
jgi:hypothetical protein